MNIAHAQLVPPAQLQMLPPEADDEISVVHAFSLTQPWATLVAIGAKTIETRSWSTPFRGWLAIHAARGFPKACQALCFEEPFKSALAAAGYTHPSQLPRGDVLAIANLIDCISTNRWTPPVETLEYAFGDYSPQRFGWVMPRVRRVQPFKATGALSIWRLPSPITAAQLA
ncbi:MAG TPA: ASCH domain-containing protein [Nevskiaceae bacterium]|nr:ASCH domain-containing protein [Nevskiaceae bacterium]